MTIMQPWWELNQRQDVTRHVCNHCFEQISTGHAILDMILCMLVPLALKSGELNSVTSAGSLSMPRTITLITAYLRSRTWKKSTEAWTVVSRCVSAHDVTVWTGLLGISGECSCARGAGFESQHNSSAWIWWIAVIPWLYQKIEEFWNREEPQQVDLFTRTIEYTKNSGYYYWW